MAAQAAMDEIGSYSVKAEIYKLRGQLLASQASDNQLEAESCFQKALEVANHQQAKFLELRAAVTLSRLLQIQGRKEEARDLLSDIYGWFTEGLDTADLRSAKTLLEELS